MYSPHHTCHYCHRTAAGNSTGDLSPISTDVFWPSSSLGVTLSSSCGLVDSLAGSSCSSLGCVLSSFEYIGDGVRPSSWRDDGGCACARACRRRRRKNQISPIIITTPATAPTTAPAIAPPLIWDEAGSPLTIDPQRLASTVEKIENT